MTERELLASLKNIHQRIVEESGLGDSDERKKSLKAYHSDLECWLRAAKSYIKIVYGPQEEFPSLKPTLFGEEAEERDKVRLPSLKGDDRPYSAPKSALVDDLFVWLGDCTRFLMSGIVKGPSDDFMVAIDDTIALLGNLSDFSRELVRSHSRNERDE